MTGTFLPGRTDTMYKLIYYGPFRKEPDAKARLSDRVDHRRVHRRPRRPRPLGAGRVPAPRPGLPRAPDQRVPGDPPGTAAPGAGDPGREQALRRRGDGPGH